MVAPFLGATTRKGVRRGYGTLVLSCISLRTTVMLGPTAGMNSGGTIPNSRSRPWHGMDGSPGGSRREDDRLDVSYHGTANLKPQMMRGWWISYRRDP